MRMRYPIFESYNEALQKLNFGPDMFVVKITDDKDSLESLRPDNHVVKIVGAGIMKSPGHPSGNQLRHRQVPLFKTFTTYNQVPVLHKCYDGVVEFLGYYRFLSYNIKLSDSGFRYYEFTLQLYNKSVETH
jgi:hypothetical protein